MTCLPSGQTDLSRSDGILGILHRSVPVLDDQLCRIVDHGQVEALRINSQKQVRDGSMAGKGSEIVSPLGQFLRFLRLFGHHFHGVEGCRVRDDGLAGFDDLSVLETDTDGTSVFDQNFVDVGVHLELSSEFLETPLDGFTQLRGSSNGDRKGGVFLEESLEDVQDVGRHGTLGGESAKDAHEIDKVANEGNGNDFVDGLRQVVEGQW
jgi:hypothetical protein